MTDQWEQAQHDIRELSRQYATAKGNRVRLEHFRRSQRAILMKEYAAEHKTTAAQEREAEADPRYIEVLNGLEAATIQEETLHWELKLKEWAFERWRTKSANKRAERNRYGA